MKAAYKTEMNPSQAHIEPNESYFEHFSERILDKVRNSPENSGINAGDWVPNFDAEDQFIGLKAQAFESVKKRTVWNFQTVTSIAALLLIAFFIGLQQRHAVPTPATEQDEWIDQIALSELESAYLVQDANNGNAAETRADYLNELMDPINDIQPN